MGSGGGDQKLSEESAAYAHTLLSATREELVRADTKAALLFAASGIVIGALLNGLLGGRWSPDLLAGSVEWIWWLGVVAAAVALSCLAAAIYPRTTRSGKQPRMVAYFGDVMNLPRDLLAERIAGTPKEINSALVDQIYQVSQIVAWKYRLIRVALWMFAVAATFSILSVLLNHFLRQG